MPKTANPFRSRLLAAPLVLVALVVPHALAQSQGPAGADPGLAIYQTLMRFDLKGGSAQAENLILVRDRVQMKFTGAFYFEAPLDGHIRGAVFIGEGTVHADAPDSVFERDNLQRMLHAKAVDSNFKTAVLRFSDDTPQALGLKITAGGAPQNAQKLASELNGRLLQETGANLASRAAVSILNQETAGFFFAEFDGGSHGRFGLVMDYQCRLPAAHFGLDGGEQGLFFAYDEAIYSPDIWMSFYATSDYQSGVAAYSDKDAIVKISQYEMKVDMRDWNHLKLESKMTMTALADGVRAIPLMINETLSSDDKDRLKYAMRLLSAKLTDGKPLTAIQEDWEGGVTVLLDKPLEEGQTIEPVLQFEGNFLVGDSSGDLNARYVRGDCWYPRHTGLNRATFDITFLHKKGTEVASIGQVVHEEKAADNSVTTEWRMDQPVALVTFAVGGFHVYTENVKMESGKNLPISFYRLPPGVYDFAGGVKTDFILAELSNCVRYFSALFGPYPYSNFGATYRPYPIGQGFPTMLMLPKADYADQETFSFIAHETSHEWWGDAVLWRSYRDQWLSEGFADYSGVLYTERRDKNPKDSQDLLRAMHDELLESPKTLAGIGEGRLVDIGPIILGHRLNTRESFGAYEALIYKKGALVLRMLDYLFSDPSTGNDTAFFDMMKDFVQRYANRAASTEDFLAVASQHFASTPIAQEYRISNLNWFSNEWVYGTGLPSYGFSYWVERKPDGSGLIHGTITQTGVPAQWTMPLPLVIHFGKEKFAQGTVLATGPSRQVTLQVAQVPDRIELDPDHWILSEKTTTTKVAPPNSSD